MTFNDREKGYETGFSEDQKKLFKIEARASKLIGYWAADKMGMNDTERESYAKDVIASNLEEPGYDDVKRKLAKDFEGRGIIFSPSEMDTAIDKAVAEATRQVQGT